MWDASAVPVLLRSQSPSWNKSLFIRRHHAPNPPCCLTLFAQGLQQQLQLPRTNHPAVIQALDTGGETWDGVVRGPPGVQWESMPAGPPPAPGGHPLLRGVAQRLSPPRPPRAPLSLMPQPPGSLSSLPWGKSPFTQRTVSREVAAAPQDAAKQPDGDGLVIGGVQEQQSGPRWEGVQGPGQDQGWWQPQDSELVQPGAGQVQTSEGEGQGLSGQVQGQQSGGWPLMPGRPEGREEG